MGESGPTQNWGDRTWLGTCVFFYLPMALASAWWLELSAPDSRSAWLWAIPGALIGLVIHLSMRLTPVFDQLAEGLRDHIGTMRWSTAMVVAFSSGVAEEWLFRGVLLEAWGPVFSTLAFAAAHPPTHRRLVSWPLFAMGMGAIAAWMTLWTGGLLAATAMHVTINALGLTWLCRTNQAGPGH